MGIHLGLSYDLPITNAIIFSPRIAYSQQGTTKSDAEKDRRDNGSFSSVDFRYKLDYLNIPLQFKFFNQPYLIAGPYAGFVISEERYNQDFGELESKVDYGFNLGVGFNIQNFFTELNIQQGFATLIELEETQSSDGFKPRNTIIQLSVGYRFN
ncbi:outer membrane beta-barrel protein [Nonlabens sp. Hel1_33_55]|uniref:outer membrane beta-barrel protein n=1 Tax=Nonlabens sp. Hel1_33_55 TaxID=1336802 RepID=UPI000B823890|nr:outer membrane beta-barrel protein [Nonlabens sp. Hel1_33_55]